MTRPRRKRGALVVAALPVIVFAIVANVIITLSLARWVTYARVARASTLATKQREFVEAARAVGASDARIMLRHVAPATLTPLIVIATVEVGLVIISEASLSFLGL